MNTWSPGLFKFKNILGITDMLEYSSWKMITSHCNNCDDMHNNDGKCDYDNIEYELCYYQ